VVADEVDKQASGRFGASGSGSPITLRRTCHSPATSLALPLLDALLTSDLLSHDRRNQVSSQTDRAHRCRPRDASAREVLSPGAMRVCGTVETLKTTRDHTSSSPARQGVNVSSSSARSPARNSPRTSPRPAQSRMDTGIARNHPRRSNPAGGVPPRPGTPKLAGL
jgi:hypothetical protein